jgi:hypothetical protein
MPFEELPAGALLGPGGRPEVHLVEFVPIQDSGGTYAGSALADRSWTGQQLRSLAPKNHPENHLRK